MSTKKRMGAFLPILLCLILSVLLASCGREAADHKGEVWNDKTYPADTTDRYAASLEESEYLELEIPSVEDSPVTDPIEIPTEDPGPGQYETKDPTLIGSEPNGDVSLDVSASLPTVEGDPSTSGSLEPDGGATEPAGPALLAFTLDEDGLYYIVTGMGSVTDPDVVIPAEYEGLPVKEIGKNAFRGTEVESVTVPASVEVIGRHAFYACAALEKVTFEDGSRLKIIEDLAFSSSGVKRLVLPATLELIGKSAFYHARELEHVTMPTTAGWWCAQNRDAVAGVIMDRSIMGSGERLAENLRMEYAGYYWCRPAGQLTYSFVDDAENPFYNIASVGAFRESELTVPTEYAGLPVLGINASAFSGCTFLTSVTIPTSIQNVGSGAFAGCTNIASMTVSLKNDSNFLGYFFGDLYSFDAESYVPASLKSLTLTGTDDVPSYACYGCANLESVTFGEGIVTIYQNAFENCTSLKSITFGDVDAISDRAFAGCTALEELTLDGAIETIGESAFLECTALESVLIGASVKIVGSNAFSGCTALSELSFEDAAQNELSVYSQAFWNCTALETVVLPARTVSLERGVFEGCNSIAELTLPFVGGARDENTFLSHLFGGYGSSANATYVPTTLKTVNVKGDCLPIYAFNLCQTLEKVTLDGEGEESFGYIGDYAFYGCTALKEVTFLSGCTSIGEQAFWGCTALEEIEIPDNVYQIDFNAFGECTALEKITLPFIGYSGSSDANMYLGYIFGAYSYYDNADAVPASLHTVVITGGERIKAYAFYGCSGLVDVTLPETLLSIEANAFDGCGDLATVTLSHPGDWYFVSTEEGNPLIWIDGLEDPSVAATLLKETYVSLRWTRQTELG